MRPKNDVSFIHLTRWPVWSASQPQKLGATMRLIWNKERRMPMLEGEKFSDC